MKYALNLNADDRILSACVVLLNGNYDGMPIVDYLPDGDISEYRYEIYENLDTGELSWEYVYDPVPKQSFIPTAPRNVVSGEYITVNGVLYKSITNIPSGEPIITGQNAIETTIEEQLAELAKGE